MKTPDLDGEDKEDAPILEMTASKAPTKEVPTPNVPFIEVQTLEDLPEGTGTPTPGKDVPQAQEGPLRVEGPLGVEGRVGAIGSRVVSKKVVPKPVDELSELPVGAAPEVVEAPLARVTLPSIPRTSTIGSTVNGTIILL